MHLSFLKFGMLLNIFSASSPVERHGVEKVSKLTNCHSHMSSCRLNEARLFTCTCLNLNILKSEQGNFNTPCNPLTTKVSRFQRSAMDEGIESAVVRAAKYLI
ncbi:hypothetical protein HAX54_007452 [Datura stramonium]|uniref:Secreted protein n=1 Tax=Datura stramonium TaxID=4076 RepID=A0ABS8WUP9_DATST|nr:hypothetical protein [Datura stramonium]MCE3216672.1 hypothetical protein [Datura stramonium]